MPIRNIARMGQPVLRRAAEPVPLPHIGSATVQTLIDDMIETMRDADGAGIAAPQVSEPVRICVIEVKHNPRYPAFPEIPLMVLVNPIVTPKLVEPVGELRAEDAIAIYEGCLSVPGIRGRVRRPRKVHVRALDRAGNPLTLDWEGVPAAVVQHEVDHLDGILFVDRADPRTLCFLDTYEANVAPEARIVDHAPAH
jgi:peptide deformylase